MPLFTTDYYKQNHYKMYPQGTTQIYSNLTARKSRFPGINKIVFFGLQYFIKRYIQKEWGQEFFALPWEEVKTKYLRLIDHTLGKGTVEVDHIKKLHDLGYMPLKIKALPEGSRVPIRVPCLTITNTVDHAYWLVNFLETILSCSIWQSITSATIAREFREVLNKYALETVGNTDFVQWQGHDFSMRGMSSLESAKMSGAGHLLSFTGTDTIPSIDFLEEYYNANVEKELVGASVPASEHSVICMGSQEGEIETFSRLLKIFNKGVLSMVSDTWSLPKLIAEYLPQLKSEIEERDGKLVIRPDSFWTDPVDCLCGFDGYHLQMDKLSPKEKEIVRKGVIESLWDIFGGTVTSQGFKLLSGKISAIYGDSISLERAIQIAERLKEKGFASINTVLGIGSYTYQYNSRDSFGFALKATYGEIEHIGREIFKDPVTDDGMKKSAKGLLRVDKVGDDFVLKDQCTWEEEDGGELKTVFENGKLLIDQSLSEIRARLWPS